jgi:regulator of sirC expression with transglutaminase-like and TPR domain
LPPWKAHLFVAVAAGFILQAVPAPAETVRDYEGCMQLVHDRADNALESALAWEQAGGGTGARHCAAMALAAIGNFSDAADQLESLAWDLPAETPDATRAEVLAQAGQFWLDARQPAKADALLSAAVDLAPRNPEIRIDRAMAYAAAGRLQDAIVDLSASILLTDKPVEALVLRASAYRQSERFDAAGEDLERALTLAPDHAGALLERGLLRRQTGDTTGARVDWQTLLDRHPGSPEAAAARKHLGLVPSGGRAQTRTPKRDR